MSCPNNDNTRRCGSGYLIVVILYILLAIMLSGFVSY